VIAISSFRSTKESKNSLLNIFDHGIFNGASLNFVLKFSPQILLFSLLIFTRFFKNLIYSQSLLRLCYN